MPEPTEAVNSSLNKISIGSVIINILAVVIGGFILHNIKKADATEVSMQEELKTKASITYVDKRDNAIITDVKLNTVSIQENTRLDTERNEKMYNMVLDLWKKEFTKK